MKPSDTTATRGTRLTTVPASQELPLEISNKIWMYDPWVNKGLGWLLANGPKVKTEQEVYGHLEDSPFISHVEFVGATESSQGTSGLEFYSGQGARLTLGSRIYFPRTEEIIRLSAVMSTDTTGAVVRNDGRGVAATALLKTGDIGLVITPIFQEGFTTGLGVTDKMTYHSFYTEEVSFPLQMANIERGRTHRGGSTWKRQLSKVLKLAKKQMEGTAFFGGSHATTLSSAPIRGTQGIEDFVSTNSYITNKISRMDLWDILLEWRLSMKGEAGLLCSLPFKSVVSRWALDKTVYRQGTKTDGVDIDQVTTPAGTFDLIDVDILNQDEYSIGKVFGIPKGHVAYRPFIGQGGNFDIRYYPINRDEVHAKEGEVYGIYGWHPKEEELFMKISGLELAA